MEIPQPLFNMLPGGGYEWMVALLALLVTGAVEWMQEKNGSLRSVVRRQPAWLRWSMYYGLVMVIFMFGEFGANEFIYSRF
jgi:hypothetical protein